MRSSPEHAAIGQLRTGAKMEDVAAYLVEHGDPGDRIDFLGGEGGVSFLQHVGNWFSPVLTEGLTETQDALADGKDIVGVFDVDEADASSIPRVLADARVEHVRYFGKWTSW
jgi:hypothetical protein